MFVRLTAVALSLAVPPAEAAELIVNGNFSAGLAGWTVYDTVRGHATVPGQPVAVVPFDLRDNGTPLAAARLQVGTTVFDDYDPEAFGGGGLRQSVSVAEAGRYRLQALFAAANPHATSLNADAGTFGVYVDGVLRGGWNAGEIEPLATLRNGVDVTFDLGAGTHVVELQATRRYETASVTPFQYVGGVSLFGSPVPEPGTWALMLLGFGTVGVSLRHRGRRATA